ncbi:AbrB family transcriptional regulator [Insolitispirillum peregrinum]|uniref:Ammonia monooxygenase n=1 Tax=Insolitispirillum peregrinum TaxID=80876 RepID=A0A1N7MZ21_9PROT|nr:AbrB family transcriptional regulator [Insolitispirillum peregrinum]SIS91129.1 hypothetical protein SAMN05421779_104435 [Insolitispirillum peregrinum]
MLVSPVQTASRWAGLVLLSLVLAWALEAVHLPAAFLLGPILAAIVMAVGNARVSIPRWGATSAQGIVGVMVAAALPTTLFQEILLDWPVFLGGIVSTLLVSSALGWVLARSRALPGNTAIWGSAPGAATVMTLMSDSYGADMRLVAFMQYLRVVCCALATTAVAHLSGNAPAGGGGQDWWLVTSWANVGLTMALALGSATLGAVARVPGGTLLVPIIAGVAAKMVGLLEITLPVPLLAFAYAIIGWSIGLRFSRDVLRHAARVFPRVFASIMVLLLLSSGLAGLLVLFAGVDPMTAYLATSPGGADSIAIIASSTHADLPFVMTMQVGRFLLVLLVGPALARLLSLSPRAAAAAE